MLNIELCHWFEKSIYCVKISLQYPKTDKRKVFKWSELTDKSLKSNIIRLCVLDWFYI